MSQLPKEIFRAYDIRGIVEEQLSYSVLVRIGQALGTLLRNKNHSRLIVGCDGRLSSPELKQALSKGVLSTGVDVIDINAAR